ncbi:hypothetical protein C8F01DRAFT_1245298 [Mycena amicta]|nr:hypothetical protein C8F01DRAFT_1245298 [Mycena amicta]
MKRTIHVASATAASSSRRRTTKSIDLRADTPFTSPPLADDFDAITIPTTQRWSRYTRPTTAYPNSERLLAQLEAVTATRPSTAAYHHRRTNTIPNPSIGTSADERCRAPGPNLRRTKDRIKSGDVRAQLRSENHGNTVDYEMVENRVVEEGPERTVSISKWREQVIRDTDTDDDMSVYYLNAEGRVHRGAVVAGEPDGTLIQPDFIPPKFPPFHAKKPKSHGSDNSSISSIQLAAPKAKDSLSTSPSPPSPSLETILSTCQPTLLHIAPVLRSVGIAGPEHLRALALLSEETRNREVRSAVLGMGVSLLEWAVLLDRVSKGL